VAAARLLKSQDLEQMTLGYVDSLLRKYRAVDVVVARCDIEILTTGWFEIAE
jgi:hypothetical protein